MNIIDFSTKQFDTLYLRLTHRKFYPLLLFILIFIGLTPLLIPGIPNPGYQDLHYHLSRLHTMDVNFSVGEIPSMINHEAKNGYGYGTGLFYPDLFLYIPVLAMKCGFNIIAAYKLFIIISVYAAAISAYYCTLKISHDHFCAFSTSILHTWSSYSATCIFFRAAIGEYSTFIFMPWILLGLYEIILGNPRNFLYLSFGFSGLLCAHRISSLMAGAICFVFCFLNFVRFLREPRRVLYLVLSVIPAVLISAAYIVPMLEQLWHFNFRVEADQEECISELFMPFVKLFLEIPNSKTIPWRPSGIGTMLIIVSLQRFRLPAAARSSAGVFRDMTLIAGLGCLMMSTEMPSWEGLFKPLSFIQFPWRFFGPTTVFLAFGGGLVLSELVKLSFRRTRYWCWLVVFGAAFSWFVNVGYCYGVNIYKNKMLKEFHQEEIGEKHYLMSDISNDIFLQGDVVTSSYPINVMLSRPQLNVLEMKFDGNTMDNEVELPITPYYGYVANLILSDGSRHSLKVGRGPNKLFSINIPSTFSSGTVSVRYCSTFLQRLSYCTTIVSIIFFIILGIYRKTKPFFIHGAVICNASL